MLIRNESGVFPGAEFLTSLTTPTGNERWIAVSQDSLKHALVNHPHRRVFINIEPCQLELANTWRFLTTIRQQYGSQVAIEITERRQAVHSLDYLDKEVHRLKEMGFELAIDDVSAGSNSYAFIVRQLNAIHRIKLSLLLFKAEDHLTRRHFVDAWLSFATTHQLDFVIEGIANQQIAQTFAGNPTILQQGFYWGKGAPEI